MEEPLKTGRLSGIREGCRDLQGPSTRRGKILHKSIFGVSVCLLFVKSVPNRLLYNNYRCDRDDRHFLNEYPEALLGIRALLNAIYTKMEERGDLVRRKSKNGTPEERKQRTTNDSDLE